MLKSETISSLAKALIAAQAEMKNPAFDATNPHFKSKYASLASVRAAVLPCLNKHGLTVTQLLSNTDGEVTCETILIHESGEYIGSSLTIAGKRDAHGAGSAATYARRYTLQAIVGVVGDDDDDGNGAVSATSSITDEQALVLSALITDNGLDEDKTYMPRLVKYLGIDALSALPANQYQKAEAVIRAAIAKRGAK